jgi:hypothetical protein
VPVACVSKQWPVSVILDGNLVTQDSRGRDVTVRLTNIRVSPAATAVSAPRCSTES